MQCPVPSHHNQQTCSWLDGPLSHDESNPVHLLARSLEQLTGTIGPLVAQQLKEQQQQQQQRQQDNDVDQQDDVCRNDGNEDEKSRGKSPPPSPTAAQGQGDTASQSADPLSATTPTSSVSLPKVATKSARTTAVAASTPTAHANNHQHERLIPSYEQWRKQILEKQNKPAEQSERKQRRRKPYQESPVDVAVGEDELGFPFSNLEGSMTRRDGSQQDASLARQLGDGPDLTKVTSKETAWIMAEYAKDPKDRFNHASATCAASVVKANKDAQSITAILNEGKDNYMLYKCDTKEKHFVVELCEEILVDTFVMGNYEFFSSTFKEFVVSVNRYPPRDDGWRVLGHFLARNSRDAQVFKPDVPQLATYIRFDFLSHYGREFYCPVTLLRVYGATALEQLKQEEEEEKRQLLEQQRMREANLAEERAREARKADGQDPDEEDGDLDQDEDEGENVRGDKEEAGATRGDHSKDSQESLEHEVEIREPPSPPSIISTITKDVAQGNDHPSSDTSNDGRGHSTTHHDNGDLSSVASSTSNNADDGPTTSSLLDDHIASNSKETPDPEATPAHEEYLLDHKYSLQDEEATVHTGQQDAPDSTETFSPLSPTSPASMQDEPEWHQGDLGIISIPQKAKPSHNPKPSNHKAGNNNGGGGVPGENIGSLPHPTPASQESVYKNIVNRLKALELNASLSHQYLEEQSNVFNDVLAGLEETSTQLVTHLNEANKRLESLGRRYDQLAYSLKAHIDGDSVRIKTEVKDLSAQLHALAAQVMFQRQLFVIAILILCAFLAFFAVTRNTTMPYTIVQSPLGAKLMSISGNRRDRFLRRVHNKLTNPDLVNGSTPSPRTSMPPLASHRNSFSKFSNDHDKRSDEMSEAVFTPPMSPISPMPPASRTESEQDSRPDIALSPREETVPRRSRAGSLASLVASAKRLEESLKEGGSGGGGGVREGDLQIPFSAPHSLATPEQRPRGDFDRYPNGTDTSPEPPIPQASRQFPAGEHFLVSRTPYSTPQHSFAGVGGGGVGSRGGHIGNTLDASHRTLSFQQLEGIPPFRPESPTFQAMPSSPIMMLGGGRGSMDDGHLSDADVAYLSRDMNVSRIDSTSPSPVTPIVVGEPRVVVTPVPSYASLPYDARSDHSPRPPMTPRSSALRYETTMGIQSSMALEQGDEDEEGARPGDDDGGEKQRPISPLSQESTFMMDQQQQREQQQQQQHHAELTSLTLSSPLHVAEVQGSTVVPLAQRFLLESQKQPLFGLEQQVDEQDEDQGFVSDSVIEGSKSDILRFSDDDEDGKNSRSTSRQEDRAAVASIHRIDESDHPQGVEEAQPLSFRNPTLGSTSLPTLQVSVGVDDAFDSTEASATTGQSVLSNRGKRRSSDGVYRSLPIIAPHEVGHSKNKSISGILNLGLGIDAQGEQHQQQQESENTREGPSPSPPILPKPSSDEADSSAGGSNDKQDAKHSHHSHHSHHGHHHHHHHRNHRHDVSMGVEQDQPAPTLEEPSISGSPSSVPPSVPSSVPSSTQQDEDRGDEGDDECSPVMDR
ncbi:hypothetical protein DFQ26_006623 [Actinomortierella ambigua]|nr:hypothetical protein DFQ26_006623 [Actinomortierella ambigua]